MFKSLIEFNKSNPCVVITTFYALIMRSHHGEIKQFTDQAAIFANIFEYQSIVVPKIGMSLHR